MNSRSFATATLLLVVAVCPLRATAQTAQYTVTELGRVPDYTFSTTPLALNNNGVVVGAVQGTLVKAFIWDAVEGIRLLPPVPGQENRGSQALDINDLGEIIGYCGQTGGSNPVGWLYSNSKYTRHCSLLLFPWCIPAAINNNSEIVGAATGAQPTDPTNEFYWSPATGMLDPIPGVAVELYDINDAGIACGGAQAGLGGLMLWDIYTGAATDLGMLPDSSTSRAYAVNESSCVAGVCVYISSAGHRTSHGVFACPGGDVIDSNLFQAVAIGINEQGHVVGWRMYLSNNSWYSWLYKPGVGIIDDLHAVIDQPALYTRISEARGINDLGQIIASSARSQGADPLRLGVILTPIPTPAPGDLNCDGQVDFGDINPFVLALTDPAAYASAYPSCDITNGDVNGDGGVDFGDINPFVALLTGGG